MADSSLFGEILIAIPATIAAGAAWRNSHKNKKGLAVTNGKLPGFMIEESYKIAVRTETRLDQHIDDRDAHDRT